MLDDFCCVCCRAFSAGLDAFGGASPPCLRAPRAACDELCDNAAVHINSGLNPASSATAAWSGDQYRAVVRLIAESPHGAVSCAHAEEQPECGGGAVLASLQKHNFLLRRSFHALARDVDEVVFGATSAERGDVYMLPSAAALCIVRARVDAKSL